MSNDTEPRVVVWEPFSTYVTLRALSFAPFIVPAIMWIAAYATPFQFNQSHTSAALARLWYHSNLLVDRFLIFPYFNHPNAFLAACLLICAIPAALYHHRNRQLFSTPFSTIMLCGAGLLLLIIPFLVQALASPGASTRHVTWWQITVLFAATAALTHHYATKLRKTKRRTDDRQ